MSKLLGFQLADKRGINIQGDSNDPTYLASFEILAPQAALKVIKYYRNFLLMPIFEGDIEEPTILPDYTLPTE